MTRARAILLGSAASIFFAALTPALALTPDQRVFLFGSPFVPMWQCILTTGVLCPGITVNSPSLGGLVADATGALTYKPNNLLTYSNTFGNAAWTNNTMAVSGGVSDPVGGVNAYTLTASGSGSVVYHISSIPTGANGISSIWARRRTGSGAVTLRSADNADNVLGLTGSWAQYSFKGAAVTNNLFLFKIATTGDAVDVYAATASAVTYETTPRAGDQVITTGSAYYGPAFDYGQGLRIWEQRQNLFLSSAVGATQNVTTAASPYTLSCWGTGTITLTGTSTAGPMTCSGATPTSTITPTSLTFTPTAGTLTLTVAGSATYVNLEQASFPGPRILTGSVSAVTASADAVTLTGTPHNALQSTQGSLLLQTTDVAPVVGTTSLIGNQMLYPYNTTYLAFYNGTVNTFINYGLNWAQPVRVGLTWSPAGIAFVANGLTPTTNGTTAGIGAVVASPIYLGSSTGSSNFPDGHYASMAIYAAPFSTSVLKSKSTVGAPY